MLKLYNKKYGSILMNGHLPEGYRLTELPGSECQSTVQNFGYIILQQYNSEQFSIAYSICRFLQKMTLISSGAGYSFHSMTALKNWNLLNISGIGSIDLHEGQHNFIYYPELKMSQSFQAGTEYQLMTLSYSNNFIEGIAAYFPTVSLFTKNADIRKPFNILFSQPATTPHPAEIIRTILNCPYEEPLRNLYFENKVKEYLICILAENSNYKTPSVKLKPAQVQAIYEAKNVILEDITKHYTIKELVQKVHLNEFTLKAGFKQIFGKGLLETLIDERLFQSRKLIVETDKPLKEISGLAGFINTTSFITAFRKKFGYTPGSLRRN